jgi:LytS/YehU family sensor histidine kinase
MDYVRLVIGVDTLNLYTAAFAVPLFLWAARRWPVTRRSVRKELLIQAVLVLIASAISAAILFFLIREQVPARVRPVSFLTYRSAAIVPLIVGVAILCQAIELRARVQRDRLEAERLRTGLADARLATLTAQLRPHFLFNTLQNVSTLMHRDAVAADELLAHLGELLGASYRYADARTISLEQELQLVNDYVGIAKVRFADRFSFEATTDGAAGAAGIPPFLLQPLVENAIEHGLDERSAEVRIGVRAAVEADLLCIEISDNGRGLSRTSGGGNGIGLRNTRERLIQTFGDSASLSIGPGRQGGTRVLLRMPVQPPQPAGTG